MLPLEKKNLKWANISFAEQAGTQHLAQDSLALYFTPEIIMTNVQESSSPLTLSSPAEASHHYSHHYRPAVQEAPASCYN